MVKNVQDLLDQSLKWGIFHIWFDELSRMIEWFLQVEIDGIVICFTVTVLCFLDI